MDEPLDELYFVWLYSQVADPEEQDPSLTYWKLLKQLFCKEFVWLADIPKDYNRCEDGKELRLEFFRDAGINRYEVDPNWTNMGCSFLEVMVGLARRLTSADVNEGEPHAWFWVMMQNIGLHRYSDSRRHMRVHINSIMDDVIFRRYRPTGLGGFFPLRFPETDQTREELWHQLCSYVLENSE
jgi:hypothetical protein